MGVGYFSVHTAVSHGFALFRGVYTPGYGYFKVLKIEQIFYQIRKGLSRGKNGEGSSLLVSQAKRAWEMKGEILRPTGRVQADPSPRRLRLRMTH